MRELLEFLVTFADHIIVDCPPSLGFADSAILGSMSDASILVVESGKTRRRVALDAIAQLNRAQNCLVGVVLTKCPKSAVSYGYNYGYYEYQPQLSGEREPHKLTPGVDERRT